MVFWTISSSTCSRRFDQKGKLTRGHWGKLTCVAKCFHMMIEAYILCKCKGPNLPKPIVVFHRHPCKDLLSQKML
jgi:hypothetical protein